LSYPKDIRHWRMLLADCELAGCSETPHKEFADESGSLLLCPEHAEQFEDMLVRSIQDEYSSRWFDGWMRRLWSMSEDPA